MSHPFSLEGRVAVVTGARSGIGAAIATALAAAGADVVLLGHRANLEPTAAAVRATGRQAWTLAADLADRAALERAADQILAVHEVDILVNNAGIILRTPAAELDWDEWDRVRATNLDAVFGLTRRLARPMLERRRGKVITVASLLAFQGGVNVATYATSKHAVTGLTRALANEWAGRGVQVNAIAPGYVHTDNTRALQADPERYQAILDRIPAGRWGEPDDVAGAAVFLASGAADYVNGHVLVVDGGWLSR